MAVAGFISGLRDQRVTALLMAAPGMGAGEKVKTEKGRRALSPFPSLHCFAQDAPLHSSTREATYGPPDAIHSLVYLLKRLIVLRSLGATQDAHCYNYNCHLVDQLCLLKLLRSRPSPASFQRQWRTLSATGVDLPPTSSPGIRISTDDNARERFP